MDFESVLLKSLIYDGEFFNKAFSILQKKHFKDVGNAEVFDLLHKYYSKYHERPQEDAFVAMVNSVPGAETRKSIIESLKKVRATELIKNTQFMIDETVEHVKMSILYEGLEIGSQGLVSKDETKIKKAKQLFDEMSKVQIDSDLGMDFDDIDLMLQYYSERNYGILTQHKMLNYRLGSGFLPGTLNVILASQGIGKSLLMCDLASGMLKSGKNVLMVTLEMSDKEMLKRIHANVFDLDINAFSDLGKTQAELDALDRPEMTKDQILQAYDRYRMSGTCGKFYVKEYPAGAFSALMLQDLVEKFENEKSTKFDCIFVDYLGIMKSDLISPSAGLYSYIKSIGEEVRAFAVKNKIAVISASQLNRQSVNKTDGVDNSMISDSLGTSMTADFLLFLLQNEEMKARSEVIAKITKNRYTGKTDSFMFTVDYPRMTFHEQEFDSGDQKAKMENFANKAISEIKVQDAKAMKAMNELSSKQDSDIMDLLGL